MHSYEYCKGGKNGDESIVKIGANSAGSGKMFVKSYKKDFVVKNNIKSNNYNSQNYADDYVCGADCENASEHE